MNNLVHEFRNAIFSLMMSSKRRNGTDTDLKRLQEEFEAEFSRPKVRIRTFLFTSGELL